MNEPDGLGRFDLLKGVASAVVVLVVFVLVGVGIFNLVDGLVH